MADEDGVDRSEWLLEPPEAGEVRLMVELGEGAELSPEAQDSLERLMSALHDAEVSGFALNRGFNVGLFGQIRLQSSCNKLVCGQHDCSGNFLCDQYKSERFV